MYSPNARSVEFNDFLGGLNVTKPPTDINDNQTPDAQNWMNNELIGINSRYGYTRYYSTAISTANINSMFVYNTYSSSDFLIANGTALKLDLVSAATAIYSGLVSGNVRSFEMIGNIYLLDGSGYIQYNGATAETVSGYIPTYFTNKNPDGTSGSKLDELNYIQSGFRETFNGNGSATSFYMSYGSLTTATPVVLVDTVTQTLSAATSGFTVNYASGIISLTTAATSDTGNVDITAYKPVLESTSITNCTFCETYGEGNDTFAFLSGNSSFPARIFWSDTLDPTYYPATSYADVGVQNDKMMGFLQHGGVLQLWKNRSVHSFNGTPPNNSITEIYVNNEGCVATDTLKVIDGYPTCLSQRGVIQLVREQDWYKFRLISEDINGRTGIRSGLLDESSKSSAFSHDFDNKYWLHVNDTWYIYQYDLTHQNNNKIVYPWLKWSLAHDAKCIASKDNYLYFGGTGNFYKFDPEVTNDDGTAIDSYYYSKKMEIDKSHDWIKWFLHMYFSFRTRLGTNFNVSLTVYIDDASIALNNSEVSVSYFNPNAFNPNQFNPNPVDQYVEIRIPLHKKGKTFQYKITCDELNKLFTLLSTKIDYMMDRKVR